VRLVVAGGRCIAPHWLGMAGSVMTKLMSRARFHGFSLNYFRNSVGPVDKGSRDSGIGKRNVHEVVLVGGSTRLS